MCTIPPRFAWSALLEVPLFFNSRFFAEERDVKVEGNDVDDLTVPNSDSEIDPAL